MSEEIGQAEAAEMMRVMAGRWIARLVHAAAELRLADHIADGARDPDALAKAAGVHKASLARVLRALAAIGVLRESANRTYTLTPLGRTLRSDMPGSMRAWVLLHQRPGSWQALLHAIRTGENAFRHVHGMSVWDYNKTHPEASTIFNQAMQSLTQGVNAAVSQHYPFGQSSWIVDVGGGNGSLLVAILKRCERTRGTVFDLPHVIEQAKAHISSAGLSDRCEAVAGDAFVTVPHGADVYVLKSVIHDWDDADAIRILRVCRQAMSSLAKLLLIERLLPEQIDPDDELTRANFLNDLNMFVNPGGRERTEGEYRELLERAGFKLSRLTRTPNPAVIVEADPL